MEVKIKNKKCKFCGNEFKPFNSFQRACKPSCERAIIERKAEQRKERQTTRLKEQKESFFKSAVTICHAYIRLRDEGKPCISCGKKWNKEFQAGHLFSGGGHSAVRFDEENINGQCKECNSGSQFDMSAYIEEFEKRYSREDFEVLKAKAYEHKSWSLQELKNVNEYYRSKIKKLVENGNI